MRQKRWKGNNDSWICERDDSKRNRERKRRSNQDCFQSTKPQALYQRHHIHTVNALQSPSSASQDYDKDNELLVTEDTETCCVFGLIRPPNLDQRPCLKIINLAECEQCKHCRTCRFVTWKGHCAKTTYSCASTVVDCSSGLFLYRLCFLFRTFFVFSLFCVFLHDKWSLSTSDC